MALEESVDGMEKIESNGISAYLETSLKEYVAQLGKITVDYRKNAMGQGGYSITLGDGDGGCGSGGCSC